MKEKELRLALVCYGGVSLVLYMQGVIKEFVKLARASKAYHSIDDVEQRQAETFPTTNQDDREHDTEAVYFSLLRTIGKNLDLRVVIDSIAGASAGGVSGITLAHALANDLSLDHLRDRWIDEADLQRLLGESQRARGWSKWFLYPLLWIALRSPLFGLTMDNEIRRGLSVFLRSRWFEAPLDGDHYLALLYDGLNEMGAPGSSAQSLMPPGHVLDLAVSVTDLHGYPHQILIDSPAVIQEREHAQLWKFSHCHWKDGRVSSDFTEEAVPALALAARATSSLPGAFPPARLADIDRLVRSRGNDWPSRERFISKTFEEQVRAGLDPQNMAFIDGSVVNDRPFSAAINAIRERAAYRDVDRRLVYINPDPDPASPAAHDKAPSFLQTLERAMFEIPVHAPIHGELERLAQFNQSISRMRTALTAARPDLIRLVFDIVPPPARAICNAASLARWREAANAVAVTQAGYAYQIYARSRANAVIDHLIALVGDIGNLTPNSAAQIAMAAAIRAWAARRGAIAPAGQLHTVDHAESEPAWMEFLSRFDRSNRHRRLSFVMRGVNELYGRLNEPGFEDVDPRQLDHIKRTLQPSLHRLRMLRSGEFASSALRRDILTLAAELQASPADVDPLGAEGGVDRILTRIAEELDLQAFDQTVDHAVASSIGGHAPTALRDEFLIAFIGFPFWDVWTLPMSEWHELEEHREIRVDRISPADSISFANRVSGTRLQGAQLRYFAGFLSRSIRENDYLWGRLNGAERLIDIVCSAAAAENALSGVDIAATKKSAFLSILDTEAPCLRDKVLVATIQDLIDQI
jgi:patatin-related protein